MCFCETLVQMVGLVGEDNFRLPRASFLWGHGCIGHDDNLIAHLKSACRRTIQADTSCIARASNGIGFNAFAVHIIDDADTFVRQYAYRIHQVRVDGDASHVVKVGLRDGGAVYFGFQNAERHIIIYIYGEGERLLPLSVANVVNQAYRCLPAVNSDAALNVRSGVPCSHG